MKIKVKLSNSGYLLPGSGEGSALIDSDPVTTPEGFPYFPARTFKGLFREAVREVLEIGGRSAEAETIITQLFGEADGDEAALLKFRNLYLDGCAEMRKHLPSYRKAEPLAFDSSRITAHYTAEVAQTAIADDGVAKDRSLRNFRAIKPETTFEGCIEFEGELSKEQITLLEKAALQLRFAGTKRNRGFGKVKVTLGDPEPSENDDTKPDDSQPDTIAALKITLTTTSAAVLSAITGDQNTVSSDSFVRGSRIRGLVAEKLIQTMKLGNDAHGNGLFREAVLSGKVHFRPAYPLGTKPTPLNVHRLKTDPTDIRDVFRYDDKITRTIGGIGRIEAGELHKVKTSVSARFHNSRLDRSAGRNMENDEEGGIFYYEGVDAGQAFSALITGDAAILQKLFREIGGTWSARIGKSKSTQYGDVKIEVEAIPETEGETKLENVAEALLHFRSPVLLYNEHGIAVPDVATLEKYLTEKGIQGSISQSATRIEEVETWNRQWRCRSGRIPAFAEGSVFLVKAVKNGEKDWNEAWQNLVQEGLGEMKEQGFGWVEVEAWDQFPETLTLPDSSKSEGKNQEENQKPSGSDQLDSILASFNLSARQSAVKLHGLEFGKNRKRINNHLLSRLEQKMDALSHPEKGLDIAAYQKWIRDLKEKPAGTTLKDKKLYEPLENPASILRGFKDNVVEGEKPLMAYLAWKAAFKTMRIRNKKSRKDNGKED